MLWVILAALLVTIWSVATYNSLVRKRNEVRNGWSQIDVQLKRRHDLIPNLVSAVRGYMEHERAVFDNLARAREQAVSAGEGMADRITAESGLTLALRSLIGRLENYPDLKASRNVLDLQEELRSTENRISFARQFYNDAVMAFNTALHSFPTTLWSSLCGFVPEPFFEAELSERVNSPAVFSSAELVKRP